MSIFSKILAREVKRLDAAPAPTVSKAAGFMALEAEGYPAGRPSDGSAVRDYATFVRTYRKLPWLYAAVTALAVAATKAEVKVYREKKGKKDGEDTVEQAEVQGTEFNKLLERPTPWLSWRDLIQVTMVNLALTGNAYWNMVGTAKGEPKVISAKNKPVELWWIKPEQITPRCNKLGEVEAYEFTSASGRTRDLSASEIAHFRLPNPDSYHVGMGIMEPLADTAASELKATTFQRNYLDNDGTPPFIFEHPGDPPEEERRRFLAGWDARHRGPKKAGRVGLVWGGMKANRLGESMKDAQYVELRKMNREEMLAGAGVPPSVVGLLEYANYSNMEVQQRKFWDDTVIPMLAVVADAINLRLAPHFGEGLWVEFDFSKVKALQEDQERQARIAETWVRCGVLSPNEIRADLLNKKPYKGGDVYYVPLGLVPVGGKDYVEKPKPEPEPEPEPEPQDPPPPPPAAGDEPPKDGGQDPDDGDDGDDGGSKAIAGAILAGVTEALDAELCACCAPTSAAPVKKDGEPAPAPSYWRGEEQRKAYWQAHEKRVTSKERGMIPAVEKYLRQQATHIKRRLSKYDSLAGVRPAELFDIVAESDLYLSKFEGRYRDAFEDAAEAGYRATKRELWLPDAENKGREFKPTPEQIERLKRQIQEAAQYFNATTWATVEADLEAAKLAGDTVEELAQDLWKHLDDLAVSRARLISRTEMARVENWGGLEGFKANEFVTKKGWLCSMVTLSREDHIAADGQEVDIDADFVIGVGAEADAMPYPGAPGAKARNVCNCLCTTYPVVEG